MKALIIHPRAAEDAREIAVKYADISDDLHNQFWEELMLPLMTSKVIRNAITMTPAE